MKAKFSFVWIFVGALIGCLVINKINISHLPSTEGPVNSKSLVNNGTIYSIDNEWYVNPTLNYLRHGIYAIDKDNPLTKVRRTPGYPIFYGAHVKLFGEQNAHRILPYTQSILFAVSVVLLGMGVLNFSRDRRMALLTSVLYGLCPFVIGFTFYTITEAIHPVFVIISFYFLSRSFLSEKVGLDLFFSGLFLAVAALIRPTNILFAPACFLVVLWTLRKNNVPIFQLTSLKTFTLWGIGIALPFVPWMIRNYEASGGEFIPFEKFYNESPMGMGRSQTYLSKWWMCFGNPRQETLVYQMIENNTLPDSVSSQRVKEFVDRLPTTAFYGSSREEIKNILLELQDCYRAKKILFGTPLKTLGLGDKEPACEQALKEKFQNLIQRYKEAAPIRYYLISPYITRGKEYIVHSFSSMYGSLNPFEKDFTFSQKIIKALFFSLNLVLWLSLIASLFIKMNLELKLLCYAFIATSFFFLTNAMHVEARYMIATYPFLYILLSANLVWLWGKFPLSQLFDKREGIAQPRIED